MSGSVTPDNGVTPLFQLDDVRFDVGGRCILHPLTLTLTQGRVYGLIGPNGSGKSTLIKMLARQQAPSAGRLRFLGEDVSSWNDRAFARQLAYMPQFTPGADGMTVRELIALGRFPWHGTLGRFTDTDRTKVDEAITLTGLGAMADRLVDHLSGGERQRVWFAMMLAQDAGCLLLDEPTSALDIAHQMEMLSLVQSLGRDRGLSVIVILHDINMAARVCDDILALGQGRLVAHGTPDEIMNPSVLEDIYSIPMGVIGHPVSGQPMSYLL